MGDRSPIARRAAGLLVALAVFLCSAAVAFGLPPFTTGPKSSPPGSAGQAELFGIAAVCHSTFDRFVIRARFATPGYSVRYVQQVVSDPSGMPVPLPGAARLHVVVRQARGHTTGGTNLLPSTLSPACRNLLKIKGAGDFEGIVSFGLGLRRKTGFRVFRLTGPTRIVVDVAH